VALCSCVICVSMLVRQYVLGVGVCVGA